MTTQAMSRNGTLTVDVDHVGLPADNQPATGKTRVHDLIYLAAKLAGVSEAEVTGLSRARPIMMVRQAVMLVAHETGAHSWPEIGRRMGGRDHSTVIHGARTAQERAKRNSVYAAFIARLTADAKAAVPFVSMQQPRFEFTQMGKPVPRAQPVRRLDPPPLDLTAGLKPVFGKGFDPADEGVKFHVGMARGSAALLAALDLYRIAA